MRKLFALLAVLASCGAVAAVASASTKTVTIKDFSFSPKTLKVRHGTTVKWVWRGSAAHNVYVTSGPVKFHSKLQSRGSFSKKLTRKGTYKIICQPHASIGMRMTIKVN